MNAPRKISQLSALLAFFCVCAALFIPPAVAGARPAGAPALARKAGAGKHAPAKRCHARSHKRHRGCRSHRRHVPRHEGGSAEPSISPAATQPAPAENPAGSPEEPEPDAPEGLESPEEEEEEGEASAGAEEESSFLTNTVTAPAGTLRWAPPPLVEPKTITLGTGYTHTALATNRDYIIKLPTTKKVGGTWIDGGRNVVIVGGYITVPKTNFSAATNEATALSIKGVTGTVHVEGVLIDGSGGGEFDAVTINAPEATIQLENLRIVGVHGCNEKIHADVVQPWGGVKDLRIDRLTGRSKCQGLTIKPDLGTIGSAELDEVDLTGVKEENVTRGGHLFWLTRGLTTCETYPMALTNVYVTPQPGKTLGAAVWPQANSSWGCPASGTKSFLGWPTLPLTGGVQLGPPSTGSYVPAGVAGLSYRSPGYQTG